MLYDMFPLLKSIFQSRFVILCETEMYINLQLLLYAGYYGENDVPV
jgi:hypothetical protein